MKNTKGISACEVYRLDDNYKSDLQWKNLRKTPKESMCLWSGRLENNYKSDYADVSLPWFVPLPTTWGALSWFGFLSRFSHATQAFVPQSKILPSLRLQNYNMHYVKGMGWVAYKREAKRWVVIKCEWKKIITRRAGNGRWGY